MDNTSSLIDLKVAEKAMLKHPFYRAWAEGRLPLETLWNFLSGVEACASVN
jgi:pyrroloquinoline-quinone synthase